MSTIAENNTSTLDPALPFVFHADHETEMFAAMREIRRMYGIRHFLLIAPSKIIRVNGMPGDGLYEAIGALIGRVREALAPEGFIISWWNDATLKVGPGGPFTLMKRLNGDTSPFHYCALDPDFRRGFIRRCEIVAAAARPHMILFEDDYFCDCYCERHLGQMAERSGRRHTREELECIFREEGAETLRLRRIHADLMRETLAGLAAETAAAVQALSPDTRLGLCQPGSLSLNSAATAAVTEAFAGRNRPWIRICGASYDTDQPLNLPPMLVSVLYTAQRLPGAVEKFYEADTFPHNRFFCSAAMLEAASTLALSYGCVDLMLYATHHLPDPLIERGYLEMYRGNRARFAALREALRGHEVAGLGLPGAYKTASRLLSRYGFPYTTRPATVQVLADAETVRLLSDAELERMLSGAVLIDGAAAIEITRRGFADLIGADVTEGGESDFDSEIVRAVPGLDDLAGQALYSMAYLRWGREYDKIAEARPRAGTEVVTEFVQRGEPSLPEPASVRRAGLMRCVNRLGGRIVLAPTFFTTQSANFYGYQKRELIRRLLRWLAPEAMPAAVMEAPNVSLTANVAPGGDELILTIFNLCVDRLDSLKLDMAPSWSGAAVELLDGAAWRLAPHVWHDSTLEAALPFELLKSRILRLRKTS